MTNDITTPTIFPARSFISNPLPGTIRCVNSKNTEIKKRYINILLNIFPFAYEINPSNEIIIKA